MRRIVVPYDTYRWGQRAVRRAGITDAALEAAIIGYGAPQRPHVVSGVGPVYGLAIDPDSEVRAVAVVEPNGRELPVFEGGVAASIGRRLDHAGALRLDALEPHDGDLMLWAAQSPDEVAALPRAPVAGHRRAWMVYDSASEHVRVFALPRAPWGGAAELASATWQSRYHDAYLSGAYTDAGLNVASHSMSVSLVALRHAPHSIGARTSAPSQWVFAAAGIALSTPKAAPTPYSRALYVPSGGGRWCVVVSTTKGAGAGSGVRGSRHRIQIGRVR